MYLHVLVLVLSVTLSVWFMVYVIDETVVIADVEFVCVRLALSDTVVVAAVGFVVFLLLTPG